MYIIAASGRIQYDYNKQTVCRRDHSATVTSRIKRRPQAWPTNKMWGRSVISASVSTNTAKATKSNR